MPFDAERSALVDILDNAALAKSFIVGLDLEQFRTDRRTFYAVVRCLEIISEASRRLGEELKVRHTDLNWRAIAGSGNVYRHSYDNVAPDFVWRTVSEHMDELIGMATAELADQT